jgi:hypothetical protein
MLLCTPVGCYQAPLGPTSCNPLVFSEQMTCKWGRLSHDRDAERDAKTSLARSMGLSATRELCHVPLLPRHVFSSSDHREDSGLKE